MIDLTDFYRPFLRFTGWTREETELLKTLHKTGKTYLVIADELNKVFNKGRTRSAVSAMCKRAGLKRPVVKCIVQPKNKMHKLKARYEDKRIDGEGISIMELTNTTCRYPTAKHKYCGAYSDPDKSYCVIHHELCHTKN